MTAYSNAEASRFYKAVAKDGEISSVCLTKEDGTFTENKEERVHLLLRTHFLGSYPTAAADNILPDIPTTNKREERRTGNYQKRYAQKLGWVW